MNKELVRRDPMAHVQDLLQGPRPPVRLRPGMTHRRATSTLDLSRTEADPHSSRRAGHFDRRSHRQPRHRRGHDAAAEGRHPRLAAGAVADAALPVAHQAASARCCATSKPSRSTSSPPGRPGAGPAPGRYRRQGAVRQGDPRGAAGRPRGLRRPQPEGPRNRAAARHRAGLHAASGRMRATRSSSARTAARRDRGRSLCLPAARARWSAPPPSAGRASCCMRGRTCGARSSAATCRPGSAKVRAKGGLRRLPARARRAAAARAGTRGGAWCWTRRRWCRRPARASSA